jgi:hypothetical protein
MKPQPKYSAIKPPPQTSRASGGGGGLAGRHGKSYASKRRDTSSARQSQGSAGIRAHRLGSGDALRQR